MTSNLIWLLTRSQYQEGPATGHLSTGFSWFPCVYKLMLRWFPRFQVATTCFSCSPPDLNFLDPYFIFMYMHYNHCHRATAHLQLNIIIIINYYYYKTRCNFWRLRFSRQLRVTVSFSVAARLFAIHRFAARCLQATPNTNTVFSFETLVATWLCNTHNIHNICNMYKLYYIRNI